MAEKTYTGVLLAALTLLPTAGCLKDIPQPSPAAETDVTVSGRGSGPAGDAGNAMPSPHPFLLPDSAAPTIVSSGDAARDSAVSAQDDDARGLTTPLSDGPGSHGEGGVTPRTDGAIPGASLCTGTSQKCGTTCVDLATDPRNCGQCGKICGLPACTLGKCSCENGVRDGSETGVDCGGTCQPCQPAKGCAGGNPCASGTRCLSGACLSGAALVAYYDLEGAGPEIRDASGVGNNAQVSGATRASGKVGQGYQFDSAGCIRAPNSPSLSMTGGTTLTMMAWVKSMGPCKADHGIILNKESTYEMGLNCADQGVEEALWTSTGAWNWNRSGAPGARIADEGWHHVAVTWAAGIEHTFVDGNEVASRAQTGAFVPQAAGLGIGCRRVTAAGEGGGELPFTGTIDEVLIFSRALAPSELAAYVSATR